MEDKGFAIRYKYGRRVKLLIAASVYSPNHYIYILELFGLVQKVDKRKRGK
jgi:hypothetical protein